MSRSGRVSSPAAGSRRPPGAHWSGTSARWPSGATRRRRGPTIPGCSASPRRSRRRMAGRLSSRSACRARRAGGLGKPRSAMWTPCCGAAAGCRSCCPRDGKSAGDDIDNPRLVELVGELALSSERFRTLWARHDVRGLDGGTTTVHHPVVGELCLHRDKLPVGDVLLVLYYADQGSDSDEKLRLLASMAQAAPASVEPLTRADRLPGC